MEMTQIIGYSHALLNISYDPYRFIRKLKKYNLVDQLRKLAEDCAEGIKITSDISDKKSDDYRVDVTGTLVCLVEQNIDRKTFLTIQSGTFVGFKVLTIQSSSFLALIDSVNYQSAEDNNRKSESPERRQ